MLRGVTTSAEAKTALLDGLAKKRICGDGLSASASG